MRLVNESKDNLTFKWKDVQFFIRAVATAGDKHAMTMRFSEGMDKDGNFKASKADVYPWVIGRFVTGWKGVEDERGKELPWSLEHFELLPSDPEQDLVLLLGSFIVNHTGLATVPDEGKKKG